MKVALLILVTLALTATTQGYRYPSLSWMSVRPARRLMLKPIEKVQMPLGKSTKMKIDILAAVMKAEIQEAKSVLREGI